MTYPSSEIKSERCTVLAKSTRICSCSMVATVWTASTKMPTSLSCFQGCSDNAGVVPLRYIFHVLFFSCVQLCTASTEHLHLILWPPLKLDSLAPNLEPLCKLPSSIFSTINDPTKTKISTLNRPKSLGAKKNWDVMLS